jgi:hypothetical protein
MIRIIDGAGGELFARRQEKRQDVSGAVSEIIAEVRARGDAALYGYTKRFDGAELRDAGGHRKKSGRRLWKLCRRSFCASCGARPKT